jgi:DNA-binding response OmpR family regulator
MGQKKILIVSGDSVLLNLLQKALSASNFQVVSVEETSDEVDSLVKAGQPDLVIVDIMVPKMKGIKVSLSIRRKCDVPIIMLTSRLAEKEQVRGLDLSSEDHLSESIDVGKLMDWIKETFARNATTSYYQSEFNGNGNGKN